MSDRDRTAMTEPLTIGQRIVAKWESVNSGWSEPADLAEAIDQAIEHERSACAGIADDHGSQSSSWGYEQEAERCSQIAEAIRSRKTEPTP